MPEECKRVIATIARKPWAITPEGLELILAIARREYKNPEAVLKARGERHETGSFCVRDGVAIIPVIGPLFPYADFFTEISGATSVESLALKFGAAVTAPNVRAIVLHIDSPGGQITGINEFANQIYEARYVKPVTAYVAGLGCSAAYWLASAANEIIADATASLGSIGVICAWTDDSEAREAAGLKDYEIVSSQSPNKWLDPLTEEGRAAVQKELDALADIFIEAVARNRGKTAAEVIKKFGAGGVMLAADAVNIGMADSIGNIEETITTLAAYQGKGWRLIMGGNLPQVQAGESEDKKKEDEEARKARKKAEGDGGEDEEKDDEEKDDAKGKKAKKAADDKEDDEETKGLKAVANERARVKAILDLRIKGHDDLVRKALDSGMSPEALCHAVVVAGKGAVGTLASDYAADAAAVAGVPSGPVGAGDDDQGSIAEAISSGIIKQGIGHKPHLTLVKK